MQKTNIVMVGMPGAGKSTVGVILAKVLNKDFVDSDLVIQKETGKRLKTLIEENGIDGFNRIEDEINASIDVVNSIIATGGSAVYGERAMNHLKEEGVVLYLRLSYRDLQERLGDLDERGVVHRPGQTLLDLYEERCALYEKYADIIIDEDDMDIEATVDAAANAWKQYQDGEKA